MRAMTSKILLSFPAPWACSLVIAKSELQFQATADYQTQNTILGLSAQVFHLVVLTTHSFIRSLECFLSPFWKCEQATLCHLFLLANAFVNYCNKLSQ